MTTAEAIDRCRLMADAETHYASWGGLTVEDREAIHLVLESRDQWEQLAAQAAGPEYVVRKLVE